MKQIQVKIVRIDRVENNDLTLGNLQVTYRQIEVSNIWGAAAEYTHEIDPKKSLEENTNIHLEGIRVEYERRENLRAIKEKRETSLNYVATELLNRKFMIKVED